MKKVKIVPDHYLGAEKIILEAKRSNPNNLDHNSWWFLHGELSARCGYDKGVMINLSEFPHYLKKSLQFSLMRGDKTKVTCFKDKYMSHINGIIPVDVLGVDEDCIGYFWTTREITAHAFTENGDQLDFPYWNQRGLCCLKSDIESCKDAYQKYLQMIDTL